MKTVRTVHKAFFFSVLALLFVLNLWGGAAYAAQVLLDKPVRAGELTLFPSVGDEKVYYYVPDKIRLATDADGNPQFSFLRYVSNVRSGATENEAREGEGGGIVHAVVQLSVSDEQLAEAKRELQRVRAGAKIEGPVVFKSGKFGLVTSFKDKEGNLATQVVGLGNAPLLDGEKAAVSMQLTKLGAKVLWESFKTATPDISFTFEMAIDGYLSPHRALIEADFDQIYEHQSFGVGMASTYLSAEIKGAFDDLRRKGAIKLTQVGDDEKLDALITTAYNKITEMMFQPLQGTGTPSLASLTSAAGGQSSLLDRASRVLSESRKEASQENERIRRENREADRAASTARSSQPASGSQPAAGGQPARGNQTASAAGSRAAAPNRSVPLVARQRGVQPPTAVRERDNTAQASARREEVAKPSFAIVAAYEMKRVRQRGIFKIDLNKYTSDSLTLRFDENIGNVSRLMGDDKHFRQVNLDDPLYRQREIVAFIDGMNATDFGQYINFVTVQLRKKHGGGDLTQDEVRIDRNNFSREGNNFKLLYGWKGDNDRRKWLDYEYRTLWSFFGGKTVEGEWRSASFGAINLAPAFQRRIVTLEADPVTVNDAGIRAITVKIFYDLGAGEQVRQVTLNPAKGELSQPLEFMLPADQVDYGYDITWRLRGNKTVESGRQKASDAILFVDELPEG